MATPKRIYFTPYYKKMAKEIGNLTREENTTNNTRLVYLFGLYQKRYERIRNDRHKHKFSINFVNAISNAKYGTKIYCIS